MVDFHRLLKEAQQILILRLIAEKAWKKDKAIYNCFIDIREAFDTVEYEVIQSTLNFFEVDIIAT